MFFKKSSVLRQDRDAAACMRIYDNEADQPQFLTGSAAQKHWGTARETETFMIIIFQHDRKGIGNRTRPVLERHAMHFAFLKLNNILERMSRKALLGRNLPAATEKASGVCWDTRKDLTHLYAAATLG